MCVEHAWSSTHAVPFYCPKAFSLPNRSRACGFNQKQSTAVSLEGRCLQRPAGVQPEFEDEDDFDDDW
jgi:hypothetical protein